MLTTIAFLLYRLGLCSIWIVQEAEVSDFDDLGMLLLGGVALAIAVAVAVTIMKMKLQEKKPPSPRFISINSFKGKEDERSVPEDK